MAEGGEGSWGSAAVQRLCNLIEAPNDAVSTAHSHSPLEGCGTARLCLAASLGDVCCASSDSHVNAGLVFQFQCLLSSRAWCSRQHVAVVQLYAYRWRPVVAVQCGNTS